MAVVDVDGQPVKVLVHLVEQRGPGKDHRSVAPSLDRYAVDPLDGRRTGVEHVEVDGEAVLEGIAGLLEGFFGGGDLVFEFLDPAVAGGEVFVGDLDVTEDGPPRGGFA